MRKITVWICMILVYDGLEGTGLFLMRYWGVGETHEMFCGFAILLMAVLSVFVSILQKKIGGSKDLCDTEIEANPGITWIPALIPFAFLSIYLEAFLMGKLDGKLFVLTVLAFLTAFCEEGMFRGVVICWGKKITAAAAPVLFVSVTASSLLPVVHLAGGVPVQSVRILMLHSVLPGIVSAVVFYYTENLRGLIGWHMYLQFSLTAGAGYIYYASAIWGIVLDMLVIFDMIQVLRKARESGKRIEKGTDS